MRTVHVRIPYESGAFVVGQFDIDDDGGVIAFRQAGSDYEPIGVKPCSQIVRRWGVRWVGRPSLRRWLKRDRTSCGCMFKPWLAWRYFRAWMKA